MPERFYFGVKNKVDGLLSEAFATRLNKASCSIHSKPDWSSAFEQSGKEARRPSHHGLQYLDAARSNYRYNNKFKKRNNFALRPLSSGKKLAIVIFSKPYYSGSLQLIPSARST